MNTNKLHWNGNADLSNNTFGECYGVDWEYVPNSSDIVVNGLVIKIGDAIN